MTEPTQAAGQVGQAAGAPRGFDFGSIWTLLLQHIANNPAVQQQIVNWIVNEILTLVSQRTAQLSAGGAAGGAPVMRATGPVDQNAPSQGQILVDGKPV